MATGGEIALLVADKILEAVVSSSEGTLGTRVQIHQERKHVVTIELSLQGANEP